jgi:hypothetical protein
MTSLSENRLSAVSNYIEIRGNQKTDNDIDSLVNFYTDNGFLQTADNTEYIGKDKLKEYYTNNKPPFIKPSVSEPTLLENGSIQIVLTFLRIKKINIIFNFETDTSLFSSIVIS